MFDNLRSKLEVIFDKIKKQPIITEDDITNISREIRIALLESDTSVEVVKEVISRVKEEAIGQNVHKSLNPDQVITKIINDILVDILTASNKEHDISKKINQKNQKPFIILMAGLQGSGKTTSCGKIAKYFSNIFENRSISLVSLDTYRPAAMEQLSILSKQANCNYLDFDNKTDPIKIAKEAMKNTKNSDIIIFDTAGRMHIDDNLMSELQKICDIVKPDEFILTVDCAMGQDAINVANNFNEKFDITSIMLSRMDGDSKGGASISVAYVTKSPISFTGTGEKITDIQKFEPKRMVDRILGIGDVVSLVESMEKSFDDLEDMNFSNFNLESMRKYLQKFQKFGGLSKLVSFLPGIKSMMGGQGGDKNAIKKNIGIIDSMTKKERRNYKILDASRRKRISKGSGTEVSDVNTLIKKCKQIEVIFKNMNKNPKMIQDFMRNLR